MVLYSNKRRLFASDVPSPSVHKRQRVHVLHSEFLSSPSHKDATSQARTSCEEINYLTTPFHAHLHPQQETDSSSSDDLVSSRLHGNMRTLTPVPAQMNDLPWWLRPSSSSSSTDSEIEPVPSASTSQVCYYCTVRPAHHSTSCGRCDRMLCDICVRSCQSCQEIACPCCSIVDYNAPFERTLCFECFDDFSRHDQQSHAGHLQSDGDHIMLAWD